MDVLNKIIIASLTLLHVLVIVSFAGIRNLFFLGAIGLLSCFWSIILTKAWDSTDADADY